MIEEVFTAESRVVPGSVMLPLGLTFWRLKVGFEREVGVSLGTWHTLAMLRREDGLSQGELCRRFDLDPSRITRLAQRLEREGWIRRERDSEDSRVMRMYLTDEGNATLEGLRERYESFEARLEEALGSEEREQFKQALGALAGVIK